MKCKELRYQLPDFISNKLSDQEKTEIEKHLATCISCRQELETLSGLFSDLKTVKIEPPSQLYWTSLLPRIHDKIEKPTSSILPEWATRFALPVAAAILLIISTITFTPWKSERELTDFQTMLQQLEPEELQSVAEKQNYSGILESPISLIAQNTSLTVDDDVLKQILITDTLNTLPSDIDFQEIVEAFSNQQIEQLVLRIEHSSSVNSQSEIL
jgi:hypothetical protein